MRPTRPRCNCGKFIGYCRMKREPDTKWFVLLTSPEKIIFSQQVISFRSNCQKQRSQPFWPQSSLDQVYLLTTNKTHRPFRLHKSRVIYSMARLFFQDGGFDEFDDLFA